MLARVVGGLGAAAAALLGWGWFEAGWVRLRTLDVQVPGLPQDLDGLRVTHLSDFHLGVPSGSARAVESAVAWVEERRPDLVLVTGDLLTHPRGEPRLRQLLERLGPATYAVLGNHDFGDARDPLAAPSRLDDLSPAHLLRDDSVELVLAGHLHDGQIAIPYGRGKMRLAHFDWRYTKGLYRRDGSVLHVSPGLGTTFVPFRFFARPEATELVLRRAT